VFVIVFAQTTLQSFRIFNIIFGVLERINCSKQFVNAIKCVWPILLLLWGHGFNLFSLLLRLTEAANKEFSMLTERVSQLSQLPEVWLFLFYMLIYTYMYFPFRGVKIVNKISISVRLPGYRAPLFSIAF